MTHADTPEPAEVAGFPLALDRMYQPGTHMWVAGGGEEAGTVRVGMDPLGIETSGTLAELTLPAPGADVTAGRPFGQLEAAKFVGPLISPVSGVVAAVNRAVMADPGLAERDPYGQGWLIEVTLSGSGHGLDGLLCDAGEITAWFEAEIAGYRLKGVIAE